MRENFDDIDKLINEWEQKLIVAENPGEKERCKIQLRDLYNFKKQLFENHTEVSFESEYTPEMKSTYTQRLVPDSPIKRKEFEKRNLSKDLLLKSFLLIVSLSAILGMIVFVFNTNTNEIQSDKKDLLETLFNIVSIIGVLMGLILSIFKIGKLSFKKK